MGDLDVVQPLSREACYNNVGVCRVAKATSFVFRYSSVRALFLSLQRCIFVATATSRVRRYSEAVCVATIVTLHVCRYSEAVCVATAIALHVSLQRSILSLQRLRVSRYSEAVCVCVSLQL